jgi:hypothetical protein
MILIAIFARALFLLFIHTRPKLTGEDLILQTLHLLND